MLGLKQPVLGIAAAILVIAVSIGFVSLFDFPTFGSWVAYLMICIIPMQIVIGITWGTNHPKFAAKRPQPLKGILLAGLTLVAVQFIGSYFMVNHLSPRARQLGPGPI